MEEEPWHMQPIPSYLALLGAKSKKSGRVRSLSSKGGEPKRRVSGTLSTI